MFGGKKEEKSIEEKPIRTLIAEGVVLEGNVNIKDSARIEGTIKGNVTGDGEIIVGETGMIEGDIECSQIIVYGKIRGNINAKKVYLKSKSEVNGDLNVNILVVEEGAIYNGKCTMNQPVGENFEENP